MEASPDEESPLNSSTVTISFEDFVRSQSEEKSDEENTKITTSVEGKVDGDQVDTGSAEENVESGEPSVQVSPRTVTIQAEVHVVSPKQESIKTVGKLASIFNQRKKTNSPMQVVSADSAGQQPPCPFVKRKSNVVLQEEDLELAEIESESTPKCSEAEKKQFMAAFKQPSTDGSKTKPVKSQVKQKQLEENAVEAEDNPAVPPAVDKVVETPKESPETPAKPSRRGRNKAKEGKETVTTPDAADKQDEPTVASSVQPVRRSRRETAGRKEPETKQRSVRTASKQNESEGDVAIAEPLDSPVTVSTPKTRKSKRDVFVAEMMSPPDAKGSPISLRHFVLIYLFQTSDESEKRKQAKRLVEKAKVIQSKTTSLEEKSTLRRSSRTEASVKRSYCEDEVRSLLTNSKRRGVDLLYSNMERLLPLPLTRLSASTRKAGESAAEPNDCSAKQEASACLQSTASLLQTAEASDCSDSSSPIKVSHRMRKKRRHCTPDQGGPHSDSEERFLSLNKPSGSDEAKEKVAESSLPESVKRKPPTPEERAKSVPVSQCLRSLAEFFDNMSYMDSCLVSLPGEGDAHRRASPVSVVFKDGMADESRDEADGGGCWTDCSLEIHSAAEALSFQRCRASVTEAWERTQELEAGLRTEAAAELSLPVAAHQQGYSFFQDGPCPLVQQRREVMETLAYRGVFASPFNRAAAALDYLPVIRSICRSEQLKEQGKVKRRFLHYLDVIHMALEKSTLQLLAQDFP
uniref:ATPase family AAA domain containing 5a n=1 Tax=Salarias fasciatus TaxID=181472 RepID=A0A672G685_SALFA